MMIRNSKTLCEMFLNSVFHIHIKISFPITLHFRPIRKFNSLLSIHEDSKENEDDNDAETETRTSGLKGHRKAPNAPKNDVDTKHLR